MYHLKHIFRFLNSGSSLLFRGNPPSLLIFCILYFVFCITCTHQNDASTLRLHSFSEIKPHFKNPPAAYRPAPLWVWNDDLTEKQIEIQLKDFSKKGFGGVFVHPRPGLITPYLSETWFDRFKFTVETAKKLGMLVWIYDENSYPSGFAGGHVPAEMPASYNQGQGLVMKKTDQFPENAGDYYLILNESAEGFRDITGSFAGEDPNAGPFYLFEKTYYGKSGWYGGYSYVDLLMKGVAETFIDVTMTGYDTVSGTEFGHTVPGVFSDEPHISPPGGIRWTPDLFEAFEDRWGYDLVLHLPSLWLETGDWKRVRHNYYGLLLELFIERWSKPMYEYCEKHNLKWTGHYWEHDWPNPIGGPDNMAMYAWHQMPGIDILMNQYSRSVHAQFGNVRAVRELSSIANQFGREQTLSETYGASGWDLAFEDMKRIADWQYVYGVNFLNQHLSYVTIKGTRKNDHPLSFSYHEPWWELYGMLNDYAGRMTLAMTSGEQVNRILVLEPTTTAWMYFADHPHETFSGLGQRFQNFIFELEEEHIEYDFGSENVIANHGRINGSRFVVGERAYDIVVLPPGMENLNKATYELLKKFMIRGGKTVSFAGIPPYIDGRPRDFLSDFAGKLEERWIAADNVSTIRDLLLPNDFHVGSRTGNVSHHRRILDDGQLILLVNTSKSEWATGDVTAKGRTVFTLNPESGNVQDYPAVVHEAGIAVSYELPPVGSVLFFIADTGATPETVSPDAEVAVLPATGTMKIERLTDNSIKLDYCDLIFDDGSGAEGIYYFRAADRIYRHFGLEGNPWNRSVQYKTNLLDKDTFPENEGFKAKYHFRVEGTSVIPNLKAIVERPELWTVLINGKKVHPLPGGWWLDRAFGVYSIGSAIKQGMNTITLHGRTMTIHTELESVFLTGDFSLKPAAAGWHLVAAQPLEFGTWDKQGMPFYSESVAYTQHFNIEEKNNRYLLFLPDWNGVVAQVVVNDQEAGMIGWKPFELDITPFITQGENEIAVRIYGSLKNLLGPHHGSPPVGAAWPVNFETAPLSQPPGTSYDVLEYGLYRPFKLIHYMGATRRYYTGFYKTAEPSIHAESKIIRDKPVTVEIATSTPGAEIYITRDGSTPGVHSERYTSPLQLKNRTHLKAIAVHDGLLPGEVVTAHFEKVNFREAAYEDRFNVKYTGGGEQGLYDGVRGSSDFNDGRWQGFEATDLDVTLELLEPQKIRKISAGFLQDIGKWIYFPVSVTFYISRDGEVFQNVGHYTAAQISQMNGDPIKNIDIRMTPQEARYIRIVAENIKTCPEGDPGAGGRAWLFVDEIAVD